jgi:4-guanidinobutyraldehyde dehydrogenase / NAD-dependent aldehyde dehydrogenase
MQMKLDAAKTLDTRGWTQFANALKFESRNLIDGRFVMAAAGKTFGCVNPVDGSELCRVASSDSSDVDNAVQTARRAFRSGTWSKVPPRARMDVLYKFIELIGQHAGEFAALDVLNVGKPVQDMLNIDIPGSLLALQYFAECIDKVNGLLPLVGASDLHYVAREPIGVVACIVPWNYPLMMSVWKVAPAIATGNSVILKPAEQSPLSAALLGRLFLEAGGPAGVFNVVQGLGEQVGKALALHSDVDKVAFTGSTEVGKLLMVYAGQSNMKRVTTECGGKSPQIILADAPDLSKAVDAAIYGIFGNQGEVCNAGSRLLVDKKVHGDFIDLFIERAKERYLPGNPFDPSVQMGPLVTRKHQQRVMQYIATGRKEGANVALGGGIPLGFESGAYVEPTLFTDVRNNMTIAREEIFGPVGVVIPFDGLEEAIGLANDTIYGLAASVWTRDLRTALKSAQAIESGIVWVNCFDRGDMTQPWGGYKQSGQGRDKCFDSVLAHTQMKSVWIQIDD